MAPVLIPVLSSAAVPQDAAFSVEDRNCDGLVTYHPKAKLTSPSPSFSSSTQSLLDSVFHLDSLPDVTDDEFLENLLLTLTEHNKANPIASDGRDTERVPHALNLFHHVSDDDMLQRQEHYTV